MKVLICEPWGRENEHPWQGAAEAVRWTETERTAFLRAPDSYPLTGEYDYIVTGRMLEKTAFPGIVMQVLRSHLTVTGEAEFVLPNPWQGKCRSLGQEQAPGLTLEEAMRGLLGARYASARVLAIKEPVPWEQKLAWQREGWNKEDIDLGETKLWQITVSRYDAESIRMRQGCPDEERWQLIRLLRRLENDIEPEESLRGVLAICARRELDFDYLQLVLEKTMLYPERALQKLAAAWQRKEAAYGA